MRVFEILATPAPAVVHKNGVFKLPLLLVIFQTVHSDSTPRHFVSRICYLTFRVREFFPH